MEVPHVRAVSTAKAGGQFRRLTAFSVPTGRIGCIVRLLPCAGTLPGDGPGLSAKSSVGVQGGECTVYHSGTRDLESG